MTLTYELTPEEEAAVGAAVAAENDRHPKAEPLTVDTFLAARVRELLWSEIRSHRSRVIQQALDAGVTADAILGLAQLTVDARADVAADIAAKLAEPVTVDVDTLGVITK